MFDLRNLQTVQSVYTFLDEVGPPSNVDQYEVLIGNREWMQRNGLAVSEEVDSTMQKEEKRGQTTVIVAVNGKMLP